MGRPRKEIKTVGLMVSDYQELPIINTEHIKDEKGLIKKILSKYDINPDDIKIWNGLEFRKPIENKLLTHTGYTYVFGKLIPGYEFGVPYIVETRNDSVIVSFMIKLKSDTFLNVMNGELYSKVKRSDDYNKI